MRIIYSIGHSTRSAEEFETLLREHDISCLIDVRRYPGSRRHPHFAGGEMKRWLGEAGIGYRHEGEALGGYRKAREDSPHTAWRVAGFRAYADHMDSEEFRSGLDRLIEQAEHCPTAIMCAEAIPWRCHRQLISDALAVRDIEVIHILGPSKTDRHELNPDARVLPDSRLAYPAPPPEQPDLI